MISDDENKINEHQAKLESGNMDKRKLGRAEREADLNKRKRTIPSLYSSDTFAGLKLKKPKGNSNPEKKTSSNNDVSSKEHSKMQRDLKEMRNRVRVLEQQLQFEKSKNETLQHSINKIILEQNIQNKIADDVASILRLYHKQMSNDFNTPSTSRQDLSPIGLPNVTEGTTHVGYDIWIKSDVFDIIMSNTSPGVVIRDLARALFSEEELLNSTVSGRPSNKNKKRKELENVNLEVQGLSGSRINAIRDTLEYYLTMRHKKMPQVKKDQIIARVRSVIASLIADQKKKIKVMKKKSDGVDEQSKVEKEKEKEDNAEVTEKNREEEDKGKESEYNDNVIIKTEENQEMEAEDVDIDERNIEVTEEIKIEYGNYVDEARRYSKQYF
ncbi:101 kDa malaria antigen-like isoform X2 [Chelonus insularis]|uniref:101 kDa malaria antigen-like isoform X2 n=1 Tax=Chelonus insularis TaxID=460826 RepID=UPI00158EF256|nr:101 kDa malaria antigen-like isoform X2 [Chelonus insularis]